MCFPKIEEVKNFHKIFLFHPSREVMGLDVFVSYQDDGFTNHHSF